LENFGAHNILDRFPETSRYSRITAWRMVASSHRAETIVMQSVQPRIRFIPGDERVHRGREEDQRHTFNGTLVNSDRCHVTQKNGTIVGVHLLLHRDSRPLPLRSGMQSYFGVTPPTVHQMVLFLERSRLIARVAGQARSIRLLLPRYELPDLE